MKTQLAEAMKDVPIADLLKLTEMLYNDVRTQIANGTENDPQMIRACNTARKEIEACKKQGIGR